MGFLKNIVSALKPPTFRPTVESVPELAPVLGPMKQGDIRPALSLFGTTRDAELRHRLVTAAAQLFGAEMSRTQLLDAWANNTPDDAYARLVRAVWRMKSLPKWSPNDPEEVADKARAAHEAAGEESRADYERLARANPSDPLPWALMLALPATFELDDMKRIYAEVERRHPLFFPAQVSMHHVLSAMWYGDAQQGVGFMRSVAQRAPVGSDVQALLVYGHFRAYADELHFGAGKEAAKAYLDDPRNRAEVMQALERSLWSPQYRPGHWSMFARHCAAAWFMQCEDHPRVKAELEKCGDYYDEKDRPWNFSIPRYLEIRKQVGL